MTQRSERDQRLRELKASLFARVAGRVMSTKRTGIDGLAKTLLRHKKKERTAADRELEHPEPWDRPID
jgi:hypothetical protein